MESYNPLLLAYQFIQWVLNVLLSPSPPPPHAVLRRPRIAVVGAGLTGISSAAHCVGHGFDVTIFEAGPREQLGGIWSRVNNTSGLQIHSIMYRFHPSVQWKSGYPTRQQIVDQITKLWTQYELDERTRFDTRVEKIYRDNTGRWIINDVGNGHFDGVIAAVGTCGEPKMPALPGQEKFKGVIVHSSRLTADNIDAKGKRILVVGGGASAVEAVEFAVTTGAASTSILSRSDKWIIPRNTVVDILLAFNVFGQETIFSLIPETLLRRFFYRDLKDLAPTSSKGLFTDTPMVNSEIFHQIRSGKASWLRGDILEVRENGVYFNQRGQGVPKNGPGREILVEGDIIIMATGFKRPSLSFLPEKCFEPSYAPPNYYLQVFPPQDPSLLCTNSTYLNAIGTVGHIHIGLYTRLLLIFLVDPLTRPREYWMKRWVDMTRFLKRLAPTAAFDFFTYTELLYWFLFCVAINPFRWKWAIFVFFGVGKELPFLIVEEEEKLRSLDGVGWGSGGKRRRVDVDSRAVI